VAKRARRRSGIVARFGGDRADLAGWALTNGDPVADAVAADIHDGHNQAQASLHQGLTTGLRSLTRPPASVAALLAQVERLADYVDDELPRSWFCAVPFHAAPGPYRVAECRALIRVDESPSIAAVLASTGA